MFKEKVCDFCGNYFNPTGGCQKYCPYCKYLVTLMKARYNDRKRRGFKGRSQPKGKDSPFYKNGIKGYSQKAKNEGAFCEICGTKESLLVHHRDSNRSNNEDSNLQVLCKKCHQKLHHAPIFSVYNDKKEFITGLRGYEEVTAFLIANGVYKCCESFIRRAVRNGTKAYGYYWKRTFLKA